MDVKGRRGDRGVRSVRRARCLDYCEASPARESRGQGDAGREVLAGECGAGGGEVAPQEEPVPAVLLGARGERGQRPRIDQLVERSDEDSALRAHRLDATCSFALGSGAGAALRSSSNVPAFARESGRTWATSSIVLAIATWLRPEAGVVDILSEPEQRGAGARNLARAWFV